MEQALFLFGTNSMLIVMSLCGIGFAMGFKRGADTPLYRIMNYSRLWMTAACLTLCVEFLVNRFVLKPTASMMDRQLVSLFFSYVLSRFLACGMSPSFDRTYLSRWRVSFIMSRVALLGVLVLVARYAPLSHEWQMALFIIALIWFVVDTTCLVIHVIHSYLVTRQAFEEFYSEDYDRYLLWTPAMILALHIYAIGWTPILFTAPGVQGLYGLFGTALWFYLFVCYERHTIYFRFRRTVSLQTTPVPDPIKAKTENAEHPYETDENVPVDDMEQRYALFVTTLSEWVQQKGFCEPELTIESLARRFRTNRTYLSAFINAHYGMPFRTWIASLRIAEAKHLLDTTDMLEQEIADKLGFSSIQSFCRTFSQIAGVSPSVYRKK